MARLIPMNCEIRIDLTNAMAGPRAQNAPSLTRDHTLALILSSSTIFHVRWLSHEDTMYATLQTMPSSCSTHLLSEPSARPASTHIPLSSSGGGGCKTFKVKNFVCNLLEMSQGISIFSKCHKESLDDRNLLCLPHCVSCSNRACNFPRWF